MRKSFKGVLSLVVLLLAGCASFEVEQTCRFVNDAGEFVEVDYCKGKEEQENEFYVATTGKTMDYKSKLRVRVRSPFGDFKAFQRMNIFLNGTLYESSNREWLYQADGFTCAVWQRIDVPGGDDARPSYRKVFAGVLSQAPRSAR